MVEGAGRRTEIDADVDLGGVAPDVVPDIVRENLRAAAAFFCCYAWEDAVCVGEGTAGTGCEVVSLVHVYSHRVDGRNAND